MYAVEDETFSRARSVLTELARELADQEARGQRRPVDLHGLVRRSATSELPSGGEAEYLSAVAADLARLFPIEELFPRRRRKTS